jgi:hypothetical protein
VDDATLDAWAASDDPVRRAHAANFRALRAGGPVPTKGPDPARAEILRRRAGKARVALGVRVVPGRR